jgi:hypothetical protein
MVLEKEQQWLQVELTEYLIKHLSDVRYASACMMLEALHDLML